MAIAQLVTFFLFVTLVTTVVSIVFRYFLGFKKDQTYFDLFASCISLAVFMTAFQYLLEPQKESALPQQVLTSGKGFVAPAIEDVNKPLNLAVHYNSDQEQSVELQTITTVHGTYVFSNKGAVLQSFSFPWQHGTQVISTTMPEQNLFLLALEKDTPLRYSCTNISDDITADRQIEYTADFGNGIITKLFTIHHDSYQIDLTINIVYKDSKKIDPLQLRLFVGQPIMHPSINWDKIAGIVNQNNGLKTIDLSKKNNLKNYWVVPTCFGFETRFLVHSLVNDHDHFVQRAYLNKNESGYYQAILESPAVNESGSWTLKFFVGPKTSEAMAKVDNRLQKTLNFGWLAPISNTMLSFLKYLQQKIGNYGWAIILLTLLLKLLLLPFTWYGEKNMRKGVDMQKKIAYLQKKYKDNPDMFNQQRAELIQKHGVPGISGCLPMLLTIPIFVGLNTVLSNSIELFGSPFLWITNLYAIDPFYILPVLTGLAMLATPIDNDPQKSLTRYMMALMMGTIACYLSAGLVLFILVNSLVTALQTTLQKR